MKSIQGRLALWLLASVLLASLLLVAFTRTAATALTRAYVAERLGDDAENLLAGLRFEPDGRPSVESRRVPPMYVRPYSGSYYTIEADGAVARSRSLWDTDLAYVRCEYRGCIDESAGPLGQRLLVWSGTFEVEGRTVSLAVAEDLGPRAAELATFTRRFAQVVLVTALLLVALQALVLRWNLAPLRALREDVARLERGEIDALPEDLPREVQPVAVEVNRLGATLTARLARSRNALGNLAHALKTPLTRARQLAARPDDRDARAELDATLDLIAGTIESQLRRARVAGHGGARRVALGPVVDDVLVALHAVFADKRVAVERSIADDANLLADREDLLELVGNLLDNAFKWCRERVAITVAGNAQLTIRVEDDGAGVPEDQRAGLTARGSRIDEATSGHGLGLAIVSDVVAAYGGQLELTQSARLGGLAVCVTLPSPTVRG